MMRGVTSKAINMPLVIAARSALENSNQAPPTPISAPAAARPKLSARINASSSRRR
jgi:hypothetical protein